MPDVSSPHSGRAAVEREREIRYWTIPQLRDEFGGDWPAAHTNAIRAADEAVDSLFEQYENLRVERDTFMQTAQWHATKRRELQEQFEFARGVLGEIQHSLGSGTLDGPDRERAYLRINEVFYPASTPDAPKDGTDA